MSIRQDKQDAFVKASKLATEAKDAIWDVWALPEYRKTFTQEQEIAFATYTDAVRKLIGCTQDLVSGRSD